MYKDIFFFKNAYEIHRYIFKMWHFLHIFIDLSIIEPLLISHWLVTCYNDELPCVTDLQFLFLYFSGPWGGGGGFY